MTNQTHSEAIANWKQWAQDNYENGADTFVECWATSDYERLIANHEGDLAAAFDTLQACARIFLERQADARNSRW